MKMVITVISITFFLTTLSGCSEEKCYTKQMKVANSISGYGKVTKDNYRIVNVKVCE